MPDISLGGHFDSFVQEQLASGHVRNASDVVRAGLRLVEDQQTAQAQRREELRESLNGAFDDPRPSAPAVEVFARLRAHHAEQQQADHNGG